jgi:mRNA-degrading endonuclease RelE of RelBE toxin-antitoxin system
LPGTSFFTFASLARQASPFPCFRRLTLSPSPKLHVFSKKRLALAICTAKPYNCIVEFIEATAFTKNVYIYLTDDEYLGLQSFLLKYPESGKLVPGSGGVRKLRWAMAEKGKRGGVRIIYYFKKQDDEIWLLTIYSKSERDNIPGHVLRQIAGEIKNV